MSETYDVVVIGGGVIGAATAFHLKTLGCERVLLIERDQTCSGATAKSSGIVRTHYSIPSNTRLAQLSLEVFEDFREALGDEDADCGWVNSGYLILAPEGETAERLAANLAMQAEAGAEARAIGREEAKELHPLLALDDVAAIGYEPRSGYADARETTFSYVRAGLERGVELLRHRAVLGLMREGGRVTGVETYAADIPAGAVVAAIGPWSGNLARWTGIELPIALSRHIVVTFGTAERCDPALPIVKDLASDSKLYFRPTSGGTFLVGAGDRGDPIDGLDEIDGPIDMSAIARHADELTRRVPNLAGADFLGTVSGPYDITPDWNPILGALPGLEGLRVACGLSGHGFKLAPALGRVLAQSTLGLETDVDLTPYRLDRFDEGEPLTGAYGPGAIS